MKRDVMITMRDKEKLHTVIIVPIGAEYSCWDIKRKHPPDLVRNVYTLVLSPRG